MFQTVIEWKIRPYMSVLTLPLLVDLQHKVKAKKLSYYTPRGACVEARYSSYSFSTSALDWCEWSELRLVRALTLGTHCTGGWVSPRAGLDTEARAKIILPLLGIELRSPGRPYRSQTLYWLSYKGHSKESRRINSVASCYSIVILENTLN
jgi:hypothetical protein